jgi:hypothetical protein
MAVVAIAIVLLILFKGASIRDSGEQMQPGLERSLVLAIGRPAGWLADLLPFDELGDRMFAWVKPEEQDLRGAGGFDQPGRAAREGAVPAVTPESFDPRAVGAKPPPPKELRTMLVTGDSLSQPLDVELARRLAGDGVKVRREPHLGTGVSKSAFVDWGKLSVQQARKDSPDAVVVFIGANEGFPLPGAAGRKLACCGAAWAAAYAFRVRRMMDNYRRSGAARVYYLRLPLPRDRTRQRIARVVNAAIDVAAVPYRSQVRVVDMERAFTPGGRYRDTLTIGGRKRIVREPDGIHLNADGARVAARIVQTALERDFRRP